MAQRILLLAVMWLMTAAATFAAEPVLQLATFRADVTPPIGDGPCVGFMPKVDSIEHPLELRGIVLRANGQTFVIAALDYQGLCNSSDEEFRKRMAEAAGTTPGRVALQSLHQHSAPVLDADAMRCCTATTASRCVSRWHSRRRWPNAQRQPFARRCRSSSRWCESLARARRRLGSLRIAEFLNRMAACSCAEAGRATRSCRRLPKA